MVRRSTMADMAEISGLLQKGKAKDVCELVQAAIDEGVNVKTILDDGLLSGMGIIGEEYPDKLILPDRPFHSAEGTELYPGSLPEAGSFHQT